MAKYDVFLSYSRADTERVAPLRDELRRLGYEVFFDVQSIDPGEQWKRRLERSIADSRAIVLCWSENTRGSEYITFEYSRGEALHKPILPWLLDKTPLPAMLEVQGITTADPAQAAAQLKPALGWPLGADTNYKRPFPRSRRSFSALRSGGSPCGLRRRGSSAHRFQIVSPECPSLAWKWMFRSVRAR